MLSSRTNLFFALMFFLSFPLLARDIRPTPTRNAAEIRLALRKLAVVGNVLYVAAHPDDENTALLAWLANERLVRAGYLSLTRGDGGQNLIGDEKGDALGVIRTQELLAARRVDGAEQYFTRAIDFGYSKTPDETLGVWGREEILADVVRRIRLFQPDVIITRFPPNGDGGHGHHTSSALLAEEAFDAAADPKRFPEQLAYTKPWQVRRLFWNAWVPQNETPDPKLLIVELGAFNALLGRQYTEIAAESRTMHKSQGFGAEARRGSALNYFSLRKGNGQPTDLLADVDLTWNRVPGGASVAALVAEANRSFDETNPAGSLPILARIYGAINQLPSNPHADQKRREVVDLMVAASGLWLEAIVADPVTTKGEEIDVALRAVSRNTPALTLRSVAIIPSATTTPRVTQEVARPLEPNKNWNGVVKLPIDAEVSAPYWLLDRTESSRGGLFTVDRNSSFNGEAELSSPYFARFALEAAGQQFNVDVPLYHRWTDRVRGELYRAISVAPAVTATFNQSVLLFPTTASRELNVRVVNESDTARPATVRLVAPSNWKIEPAAANVTLTANGGAQTVSFRVTPLAKSLRSDISIAVDSGTFKSERARSTRVIDHAHLPLQTMYPLAAAHLVRADVRTAGKRIGYISGPGDEVPEALTQLGYTVDQLTDATISGGQLDNYDAIVAGVRAFNTRDVLKRNLDPLLGYVERGGTMIVQYNTADETLAGRLGPYPLKLGRDRVTVESAPIRLAAGSHPLLQTPNVITEADFSDWVQERGLYFASSWDPKYETLLSSNDPGEKELPGGLLVARHGKGLYIVTGYAFFRQLPAGNPGAYRLFANLVSSKAFNQGEVK